MNFRSASLEMLCHICKNIDLDSLISANGFLHHKSLDDLKASATSGCELCELIINIPDNAMFVLSSEHPLDSDSDLPESQIVCRASRGHDIAGLALYDPPFNYVRFWQPKKYFGLCSEERGLNIYLKIFALNGKRSNA